MEEGYFDSRSEACIHDFQDFLSRDSYIATSEYDSFLEMYRDVFELFSKYLDETSSLYQELMKISNQGSELIKEHNESFLTEKLEEYSRYFDLMFTKVDPNILLDEDQRRAILIDEDYSLVIAGAGSGKTTTMAAKVKYLVEKKNVPREKILLLAFTNKAAEELDRRINYDFQLGVRVLTFHKLGMEFLRIIFDQKPVQVIDGGAQYQVLAECFKTRIFPNKVKIEIEERQRDFNIEFMNKYAYINNQGYILEIAEKKLDNLITIQGLNTSEDKIEPGNRLNENDLQRLETVIEIVSRWSANQDVTQKITSIDVSDNQNYAMYIEEEKKKIYLGDKTNLGDKILWAQAIMNDNKGIEGEIFVDGNLNGGDKPRFRQKV